MTGDEQERFEDYIELENYISALQAGQKPHPPAGLTPEQLHVYQMAALLRSLAPDAAEPRPEFAAALEARLLSEVEADAPRPSDLPLPGSNLSAPAQQTAEKPNTPDIQEYPTTPLPVFKPEDTSKQTRQPLAASRPLIKKVSRRNLLTGGAVAAASLAVGIGTGMGIDHRAAQSPAAHSEPPDAAATDEVAISPAIATTWLFVTDLDALGTVAVRFSTESVVGYVLRIAATSSRQDTNTIIAVSAACTHKGCIVQWHNNDRLFHCPCHGGLFDASGTFVNVTQYGLNLAPLPRFNVKIEQGKVYVEVPAPHATSTSVYSQS